MLSNCLLLEIKCIKRKQSSCILSENSSYLIYSLFIPKTWCSAIITGKDIVFFFSINPKVPRLKCYKALTTAKLSDHLIWLKWDYNNIFKVNVGKQSFLYLSGFYSSCWACQEWNAMSTWHSAFTRNTFALGNLERWVKTFRQRTSLLLAIKSSEFRNYCFSGVMQNLCMWAPSAPSHVGLKQGKWIQTY